MKQIILLSLILFFAVGIIALNFEVIDCGVQEFPKKNWQEPNDWFFNQRAFPNSKIDVQAHRIAKIEVDKLRTKSKSNPLEYSSVNVPNISGRIVDVEMFRNNEQRILVGSASGGVFESLDQGETWTSITDLLPSLSIADIEISKSNEDVIYLATGEPNAGGGSLAYDGTGIYKSIDSGDSWAATNLDYSGSIGKIEIDPNNSDKVIAGLMGNLFENDSDRGVFITEDGGESWEQTLFVDDSTGVIDLVIDPNDSNIVYCAAWTRVRRPSYRNYGGTGSGIYKSVDGAKTWTLLTGFPNNQNDLGRIGLGISKNLNPSKIYAVYSSGSGPLLGFSSSEDGGDSWDTKNASDLENVPFMWWFGSPKVDPTNADKVFYPGFDLQYSMDGANSWNDIASSMHVDQHAVFIHPDNSNLVLAGNDGGLYKSLNGGSSFQFMDGIQNLQFYTCEVNPHDENHIYGGAQDNSTIRTLSQAGNAWTQILGGDGFVVQVDPEDENVVYAEWQRGRFNKSTTGGTNMQFAMAGISNSALFNWKTPYVINPSNSSELFIGAEKVYKTTNKAESWFAISEDLSENPSNGNLNYGTITAIDISPVNDQFLIAGTDNGKVHITTDGGVNWIKVSEDLPEYWVTSVQADPEIDGTAYVSFSGYRYASDDGYIYKTIDYGTNWVNITGNLPAIPVNEVMKIPGVDAIFTATDVGVFSSPVDFVEWELSSENLPIIVCTDLDFHATSQTLTVATYGRGIYQADLGLYTTVVSLEEIDVKIYPNPSIDQILIESEMEFDEVNIINFVGENCLKENFLNSRRELIDLVGLSAGNYFIQLKKDNKLISSKKIVKL